MAGDLLKIIGTRIRTARKALGLSQEKLAELASIHPTYVSHLENGKINATLRVYESVAKALGLDLAQLVESPRTGKNADRDLLALFAEAKALDRKDRQMFLDCARGILAGIRGAQ